VGWNDVEYEALGEDFHNRGRRIVEQIQVLRALWTQEVVDFTGKWHRIDHAGINPLPVQRPIPLWMGGMNEAVMRRVAKYADGWFPQFRPGDAITPPEAISTIHEYLVEAGRQPSDLGIEARVNFANSTPDDWRKAVEMWQGLGAGYIGVNTMGAGFTTPQQHIEAIRTFKDAVESSVAAR